MSDAAKSNAVAVAAKIAGQAATIGAHGVPVGPLAEEVVGNLLGALLDVQDEQLATLRSIDQGVTQLGQDVAQLIEGPYRTAREMVQRAMIPGRQPDAVKADLQAASAEFLRAAAQHRDASLPRASAYMEASFVQGLLGDVPAMRYYGDKAWKEGIVTLRREAENATNALGHPIKKPRRGQRSFWACRDDPKYSHQVALLKWGEGGADLAEVFPEARAVQHVHDTKRQVDVYRDAAVNLSDGPDVLPHHMAEAQLDSGLGSAYVEIHEAYHINQLRNCRDNFASLLRRLDINEHLYAASLWLNDPWVDCLLLETIDNDNDPRAVAFKAEVKKMFPYELRLVIPISKKPRWFSGPFLKVV